MTRACLFFLPVCLAATLLFFQPTPVSTVDPSAEPLFRSTKVSAAQAEPKAHTQILDSHATLPLSFETNRGQTDARVKFLSRTEGYSLFLTADELVLAFRQKQSTGDTSKTQKLPLSGPSGVRHLGHDSDVAPPKSPTYSVLRMKLRKANPLAAVAGIDKLAGEKNYFIGNDPAKWRANVPTYAKVKYEGIYPGIDLVYYGNKQRLEYDFVVAPGANSHRIVFDVRGAKWIHRDADGDLVLKIHEDEIRWHKPVAYQERDGNRQLVAANYAITDNNQVRFELEKYDPSRPLYIDPLIYSTYLGGSSFDSGRAIAVDETGNAYVAGKTYSPDFPVTSGAFQATQSGDVFVTKFNPTGSALIYSTYLGGSGSAIGGGDVPAGISVDASGNAYITGTTYSNDFPITAGAFQTVCGCGGYNGDGFVTKLNPAGSALVYSSYLGGSSNEFAEGIALDSTGNAYITGFTSSSDFPTTPGAFQTTNGRGGKGFVTKFNATGSGLMYSTLLGGTGVNYFGGDHGYGVAVDGSGDAYVTGVTNSRDFPTTPGAFQSVCDGGGFGCSPNAFVTKFNATGSDLVYSTFVGGTDIDWGMGIAVDTIGNAYITGSTYSKDFPVTLGGFQRTCGGTGGNCLDAFVSKINATGSALVYSNYLGGTDSDWGIGISLDSSGHAYITGYTESVDFPMMYPFQPPPTFRSDRAFVVKTNPNGSGLAYSSYLGEIAGFVSDYEGIYYMVEPVSGIALDSSGNAYLTGNTNSYSFPTMSPLQPFLLGTGDAFVAKISAAPSSIILSPLHLDFRNQPTGVASNSQVSLVKNTGNTALMITSIGVTGTNSGDFTQTNDCGASIQPGSSCSITVTFTPTAIGNRSAVVKIVDSSPRQWISLTGLGLLDSVTKFTSNKNPSALGTIINFSATVSSPAGGTPTGTLEVRDGGSLLVSKTLIGGTIAFSTSKLPLGLNALTIHYSGDPTYGYSDTSLNQYVLEASTTTTLTSLPNPSAYGQAVTFVATVTSNTGAPTPDGEAISFVEGTKVLGTKALSSGSATFTTATLPAGKNPIKAVYAGDANFIGSSSKPAAQIVNKASTTMTLVSSQNPSNVDQSVTFTANVVPSYGGTVKGTVTFYDGSTKLASLFLSGPNVKFTTSKLAAGSHSMSATYGGSTSFAGSSASLTQKVN